MTLSPRGAGLSVKEAPSYFTMVMSWGSQTVREVLPSSRMGAIIRLSPTISWSSMFLALSSLGKIKASGLMNMSPVRAAFMYSE